MRRYLFACILGLAIVILFPAQLNGQKPVHSYDVIVTVVDGSEGVDDGGETLAMATCALEPLKLYTATDIDGKAFFSNVPAGRYVLKVSYVGFETSERELVVGEDLNVNVVLIPSSLALKEVTVVAKQNSSGESTSSIIGRQAIDHLQAMSLDDVMQLVPGHLMKNTDLTSQSNAQIRTLVNNNTNAFGTSIVMDGVPMSNNGAMTQGGFSGTSFVGTDLRQVSADDIESVEVIRGIPSAEYGDLTSGVVIVHSKVGQTPLQIKGKINPSAQNYSLSKGLGLGKKGGVLNFSLDYAQAWGDPRNKTKSFNRYTGSAAYSRNLARGWHTTTRVRYVYARDWNGNDPDAIDDGTFKKDLNQTFAFSHNGRISVNRTFSRMLNYTIGVTYTSTKMRKSAIVPNPSGMLPILTATETGYHNVAYERKSYQASGGSESQPLNVFAKISNTFVIKSGATYHSFKMGAEYKYDYNNARGYYNDDDEHPLQPNSNGRPRPFYDIPAINQLSAYIEDNFRWEINPDKGQQLVVQLGGRFSAMQPGKSVGTYAFSPRINVTLSPVSWLNLRGGFGLNSKTPGLDYLYPDRKYIDRIAANYMPQDDPAAQLLTYHTYVYDVKRNEELKNAQNRKWEAGFDIKLPNDRQLSLIAYHDKTTNGFGALTEYFTYQANTYSVNGGGLVVNPGLPTQIDWGKPDSSPNIFFATTGKAGNTNVAVNRGIEIDFGLGEIPAINTTLYLTGAYQETKSYSTNLNSSDPADVPSEYKAVNTTPFKIVYPSMLNNTVYRQFSNNLRIVTNIPALRLVASFSAQAIWYNYTMNNNPPMDPIGWIDTDLTYHEITPAMLADENYMIKGVPLKSQLKRPKDNVPTKAPITWLLSGRLTKELGSIGGISFYANNILYYEPYMKSSTSNTLMQRNTGSFSFGAELYFNI